MQLVCTCMGQGEGLYAAGVYLYGPGGQGLQEAGLVGVVHHGQVDPGLLQPLLEAHRVLPVLQRSAQTERPRQPRKTFSLGGTIPSILK